MGLDLRLLVNENLIRIPIDKKWERVKATIDSRIKSNISELCQSELSDSGKNPNNHALAMAKERLELATVESRKL